MTNDFDAEKNPFLRDNAKVLISLFVLAFGIRLIFLQIAPNNTTDAWSRYHNAVFWLQNPAALPPATATNAWLPLHFWLLGTLLWLTKSEAALRLFTALLAALTVLLYWGIVRRAFDRRVALASSFLFALFGFHIAFSVTTGSEAPTIFFMVAGIYGWIRFASDHRWPWAILSAVMFGCACLCRFEPWLCAPLLGVMLLDPGNGFSIAGIFRDRVALRRAIGFALLGSAAAIGWMVFSVFKWGDPLELPHRTVALNLNFRPAVLRHSIPFRLLTVPASLMLSLSPVVAGLAAVGVLRAFKRSLRPARALAVLALVLFAFNYWNSIHYEVTQARYTLLYSWLLFPFAFEALEWFAERLPRIKFRTAIAATMIFFLLWEAGIMVGATHARPAIADRLSVLSPSVPLHREMRDLTSWLLANRPPSSAVILDEFNWDSPNIARFAHLDSASTFHITQAYYNDRAQMRQDMDQFVRAQHPALFIGSPYGPIGTLWSIGDRTQLDVPSPRLHLELKWQGPYWRVYAVTYPE